MDQEPSARRLRAAGAVSTMSKVHRTDRAESAGPADLRRGDDVQVLPAGLVRLSDPSVGATGPAGPPTVARTIAHRGRVTLFHAREKVGKSTLLRAGVAAVTRGVPFLEQPTIPGRVLWVGEEAVGDIKGQLLEAEADLDAIFFIRQLNPNPRHASSLPELVALLRPVWVLIDTWQHYLKAHRVTDTAGPGEQGLLLGDVVDLAQEYDAAITVSHHNVKNRNEYRDSTALGAVADMIVSLDRGKTPTARRLRPSGRWPLDPVDIRWTRGVGYEVVEDADAEPSTRRSPAVPIDDCVLLHLLELGPDARPPARVLAGALQCQGRRYEELSAALERLVADGSVDHVQRPGTTSRRDRGYALTPRGHLQTESLRRTSDSEVSTNREEAEACPKGATVSEPPPPGVTGNGNAPATLVKVKEGQSRDTEAGDVDGQEGLS